MNCVPFGAMISLIHGMSDIFIAASRIASHTEFKVATRVIFISGTAHFILFRNLVIPAYTLACWQKAVYAENLS